ncbi:hypothetical protein LFM09_02965 [Lentzea alba]|uniref:hypothetical protein n=1 Tax=Lentzea alba TaxID=2714351 RepID=UPI0039BF6BA3
MIDRRKIAVPLVLVGAGVAILASFLDAYSTTSEYPGMKRTFTSSLWIVTSEPPLGSTDAGNDTYYAAGWPVVITALVMVIGVVLTLRKPAALVGRPLTLVAAGGLAGVVLFYITQLLHEEALISDWPVDQQYEMVFQVGVYLLIAAAVAGLAGAVLLQQQQQEQPEEEEDEDEVVVHQLDADDDTPPFGIAIPNDEQQEAR